MPGSLRNVDAFDSPEIPVTTTETPLLGPPPREVQLAKAPLVKVLAQVRFPLIAKIGPIEFVGPFQDEVRDLYPVLRQESGAGVSLGGPAFFQLRTGPTLRFHSLDEHWCVTLTQEFLTLETSKYLSRKDFLARFEALLRALVTHFQPAAIDRLGVRYIDRVKGDELEKLQTLLRPEVVGLLRSPLREHLSYALAEHLFSLPHESGQALVRWGLLSPNATVDPGALQPISEESWILDIDASCGNVPLADVETLVEQTRRLAERCYAIFRWTVTDDFLRHYGGTP